MHSSKTKGNSSEHMVMRIMVCGGCGGARMQGGGLGETRGINVPAVISWLLLDHERFNSMQPREMIGTRAQRLPWKTECV
jgi:hypothetical protein